MISTVGRAYLTSNIENDEYSYPKAFSAASLTFAPIQNSAGRRFEKLDIRFVKDTFILRLQSIVGSPRGNGECGFCGSLCRGLLVVPTSQFHSTDNGDFPTRQGNHHCPLSEKKPWYFLRQSTMHSADFIVGTGDA